MWPDRCKCGGFCRRLLRRVLQALAGFQQRLRTWFPPCRCYVLKPVSSCADFAVRFIGREKCLPWCIQVCRARAEKPAMVHAMVQPPVTPVAGPVPLWRVFLRTVRVSFQQWRRRNAVSQRAYPREKLSFGDRTRLPCAAIGIHASRAASAWCVAP